MNINLKHNIITSICTGILIYTYNKTNNNYKTNNIVELNGIISDKKNELENLLRHRRTICKHNFVDTNYKNFSCYDGICENGCQRCTICQTTQIDEKNVKVEGNYSINVDDYIIRL